SGAIDSCDEDPTTRVVFVSHSQLTVRRAKQGFRFSDRRDGITVDSLQDVWQCAGRKITVHIYLRLSGADTKGELFSIFALFITEIPMIVLIKVDRSTSRLQVRHRDKDLVPVGLRNVDTESAWSKSGYMVVSKNPFRLTNHEVAPKSQRQAASLPSP